MKTSSLIPGAYGKLLTSEGNEGQRKTREEWGIAGPDPNSRVQISCAKGSGLQVCNWSRLLVPVKF